MLLSHRHRYLFVHIAKTGGTSVRAVLARRRWLDPWYWPGFLCRRVSRLCRHRVASMMPRHAPAIVAQEILPPDLFAELYKFAFVRNPWDRLVSSYAHFQRERQDVLSQYHIDGFEPFVHWMLHAPIDHVPRAALVRALRRSQFEYLVDWQGTLLVDFVGRFERLEEDFRSVTQRLRLEQLHLPHKRRSAARGDYRAMYSDALAEEVGRAYAADVSAFGYSFDRQAA